MPRADTHSRLKPAERLGSYSIPGYILLRKISEGGCAEIYEAGDVLSKQKVAIKILHPANQGNKVEIKRLLAEGAIGVRLGAHKNIVRFIQKGRTGRVPYVVLELLTGSTLREILRQRAPLSEREVLELAAAMGSALKFLHQAGIYHKDVKPENIFYLNGGGIKLIDFGIAETRSAVRFRFFSRKLDGSPAYLAPELIRTKKPGPATDLYALGCTLYEALTGNVPFVGSSDSEVLTKQMNPSLKPDPITKAAPKASLFVQKLIYTALEKKIENRFKSVEEFLFELSRNPIRSGGGQGKIPMGWLNQR